MAAATMPPHSSPPGQWHFGALGLGTSDNAIVVRWGWHEEQRQHDPLAREFRVYAAPPMDAVGGTVVAVTTIGPGQVTTYDAEIGFGFAHRLPVGQGYGYDQASG